MESVQMNCPYGKHTHTVLGDQDRGTKRLIAKGIVVFLFPASFSSVAESLSLSEPETYRYLNQSGCVTDENLNDAEMFSKVMVSPVLTPAELLDTISWTKHAAGSRSHRQNLFALSQNLVFNKSEVQLYLFMVKTRLKKCF